MLAISNESSGMLKQFVAQNMMNYTVISNQLRLPAPFGYARYLPTTFFIDKAGKVKLVVEGAITKSEIEAVLKAKQ